MATSVNISRILARRLVIGASRLRLNHFTCETSSSVSRRPFHSSLSYFGVSEIDFNSAKERLNKLQEDPGNDVKLKIYGLFKQSTVGQCDKPKPGAFDFVAKAKWSAWNDLGSMTKEEAMEEYVQTVDALAKEEGHETGSGDIQEEGKERGSFQSLLYTVEGKLAKITLNRPKVKNSLSQELYREIISALKQAEDDDNVSLCTITGAGDYYCSGNDLNNFARIERDQIKQTAEDGGVLLEEFVNAFIDFPKPLVAAVNGPAIGVAVTTLGLCDVVYASDTATFKTPFVELGQTPEGCSSYIFPKIMGSAKANEVLLFGKKLSAHDAKDNGLVTEVFKDDAFKAEVSRRLIEYSESPKLATISAKNLIRTLEKDVLKKVNKSECELLVKLWQSEECMEAIMNFFVKKSK